MKMTTPQTLPTITADQMLTEISWIIHEATWLTQHEPADRISTSDEIDQWQLRATEFHRRKTVLINTLHRVLSA